MALADNFAFVTHGGGKIRVKWRAFGCGAGRVVCADLGKAPIRGYGKPWPQAGGAATVWP
jgi:hypothetical protein